MRRGLQALVAVAAIAAALAIAQPRVTPRWALYVGDPAARSGEALFLEPFPNAGSCGAAARALGTTGQWTRCRAHLVLTLAHSAHELTLERDFRPGGAWERLEALCGLDPGNPADRATARKYTGNGLTSHVE